MTSRFPAVETHEKVMQFAGFSLEGNQCKFVWSFLR